MSSTRKTPRSTYNLSDTAAAAAVTATVTAAAVTVTAAAVTAGTAATATAVAAAAAAGAAAEAASELGSAAAAVEAVQAAIGAGRMAFGSGATIDNWVAIGAALPQSPSSTGETRFIWPGKSKHRDWGEIRATENGTPMLEGCGT